MIRQLIAATLDPGDVVPGLAEHQAAMIERCPYLGPSVARGLTIWSAYHAEPSDTRELLALLAKYAEHLRQARRQHGPLVCRNIAIFGPDSEHAAKALMDWPAWLARNLYAPVQLMIDRFWIGCGRDPQRGRSILPPLPVSFFMVRCAIAHRDRLIITRRSSDELAHLKAGPGDDDRDVLAAAVGQETTYVAAAWPKLVDLYPVPDSKPPNMSPSTRSG